MTEDRLKEIESLSSLYDVESVVRRDNAVGDLCVEVRRLRRSLKCIQSDLQMAVDRAGLTMPYGVAVALHKANIALEGEAPKMEVNQDAD